VGLVLRGIVRQLLTHLIPPQQSPYEPLELDRFPSLLLSLPGGIGDEFAVAEHQVQCVVPAVSSRERARRYTETMARSKNEFSLLVWVVVMVILLMILLLM
jgi:hypothetical protein